MVITEQDTGLGGGAPGQNTEKALDLGWQTLSECFEPQELLMKQALIEKYFPRARAGQRTSVS